MPRPPCMCIVTTESASSGERAAVVWRECRHADGAATPCSPVTGRLQAVQADKEEQQAGPAHSERRGGAW